MTGVVPTGIAMFMQSSPTWLVANWKMNGDAASVRAWAYAVNAALAGLDTPVRGVFCPPTAYLAAAAAALPLNAQLQLGAQNCHSEKSGAFTGETSAYMLKDMECGYVIVGHSERRAAGETDEQVLAKAKAAITAGLIPIICVGESRAQYEQKQTNQALDGQLALLKQLPAASYLIAYEPIWAIGSSKTPEMLEIAAAHSHIKTVLGSATSVLYGGSVNAGNAGEILRLPEVAGALIGGASLSIKTMCAMIALVK